MEPEGVTIPQNTHWKWPKGEPSWSMKPWRGSGPDQRGKKESGDVLTRAVSRERVPLIDTVVPESFTWRRYEKFDEAC